MNDQLDREISAFLAKIHDATPMPPAPADLRRPPATRQRDDRRPALLVTAVLAALVTIAGLAVVVRHRAPPGGPTSLTAVTDASPPTAMTETGTTMTVAAPGTASTVAGPNHSPEARDDVATTSAGTPVVIDVLANDSDPDGDSLSLLSVSVTAPPEFGVDRVRVLSDALNQVHANRRRHGNGDLHVHGHRPTGPDRDSEGVRCRHRTARRPVPRRRSAQRLLAAGQSGDVPWRLPVPRRTGRASGLAAAGRQAGPDHRRCRPRCARDPVGYRCDLHRRRRAGDRDEDSQPRAHVARRRNGPGRPVGSPRSSRDKQCRPMRPCVRWPRRSPTTGPHCGGRVVNRPHPS